MLKKASTKTMSEIRAIGINALVKSLGVVATIRFLQYEDSGHGNYSYDRHNWLKEEKLDEVAEEIKKYRNKT